jgi:putative membrane protein
MRLDGTAMMSHKDWGWRGMIFGPIMIIVVLVERWLVEPGRGGGSHYPPGQTPMDILEERFAKSEIDKDEFEDRLVDYVLTGSYTEIFTVSIFSAIRNRVFQQRLENSGHSLTQLLSIK